MAGILKPSTAQEEASYIFLSGKTSSGHYDRDGSGLFNSLYTDDNVNSEGYYYNKITSASDYVTIKTEDYCNIYAYASYNSKIAAEPAYNYASSATGKLKILQHDGSGYNVDVTDKYWIGKNFTYQTSTATSNGLTFEQFLSTELIDKRWQKIVSNLPPGQYKFVQYSTSSQRADDEWFLEKVINYSHRVKDAVVNAIQSNNSIQKHILTQEID